MEKVVVKNKKAYHDYFVESTVEAGIVLAGSEVKSIRLGNVNLKDCYADIKSDGIYAVGIHIAPYEKGSFYNLEPRRDRKLLLNKSEIVKLKAKVGEKGYTLVPLSLYFKDALVKIELGLCKGKEMHDKRAVLADKQTRRDMEREIKSIKNLK